MIKRINERLAFKINKRMFILLSIITILVLLNLIYAGKSIIAYQHAEETRNQIADMAAFIDEYNKQAEMFNNERYRAVRQDQLDTVQSDILTLISNNKLNLISLKTLKINEKTKDGSIYEVTFSGNWQDTVNVVANFHSADALISMLYIKFVPTKDNTGVITTMKYKVYTK